MYIVPFSNFKILFIKIAVQSALIISKLVWQKWWRNNDGNVGYDNASILTATPTPTSTTIIFTTTVTLTVALTTIWSDKDGTYGGDDCNRR